MELPLSKEEFLRELGARDIHAFLDIYQITNDQGDVLDFKDHPYLIDIYNDWSPKQCIKKCAQVGISTTIVLKALWAAKNKGIDIIYSFPTYDLAQKMVSSKVNRLISNNPILQEWTRDKDSVEQKRVGKNMLYFQGTMNEQAAIALPADLYIADEVDRSDQKVVELFSSRLQHSKFRWEWRFSNPSVPENGVDVWWQESDQKEWFVRCSCERDQILTMEHIKGDIFACEKCGKELNRTKGQWVKRWRDEGLVSGYHISSLMANHLSAKDILKEQKDKPEQQFTNMILGEPYVGAGNYLPKHVLFSNLNPHENPQDAPPVIGVDTGKRTHYVVGNKYGLFFNRETTGYAEIEAILKRDLRAICVIDIGGDISAPMALQEKYPGRVYACVTNVKRQDTAPVWNESKGTVQMDRNKGIQLVVDEFTEKRIPIFGGKTNWEMYADHWGHLYRELEEDERGRRNYIWKRNGADHLALATLYWRVGMDKVMGGEGELIMPGQNQMYLGMNAETGEIIKATLKGL